MLRELLITHKIIKTQRQILGQSFILLKQYVINTQWESQQVQDNNSKFSLYPNWKNKKQIWTC